MFKPKLDSASKDEGELTAAKRLLQQLHKQHHFCKLFDSPIVLHLFTSLCHLANTDYHMSYFILITTLGIVSPLWHREPGILIIIYEEPALFLVKQLVIFNRIYVRIVDGKWVDGNQEQEPFRAYHRNCLGKIT